MLIKTLLVVSFLLRSVLGDSTKDIVPDGTRRSLFSSKSCFCFQKPVSDNINEVLDANGNGLERLVVYLYKDIKTNEIKMYTPNIEKQRMIPNLMYEDDDSLNNIKCEEIIDIFNTNSAVINTNPIYDSNYDIAVSKQPLEQNVGELQENDANQYHFSNTNSENEGNMNSPHKPHIVDELMTLTKQHPKSHESLTPDSISDPGISDIKSSDSLSTTSGPDHSTSPNDQESSETFKNPESPSYLDFGNHNKSIFDLDHSENDYNDYSNSGLDKLVTNIPKQYKPKMIYSHKGDYLNPFQKWLEHQMAKILGTGEVDLTDDFLESVHKILSENNIKVTEEGMLSKDGIKMNINDINLRPIFIGNSVGHYKLSEDKSTVPSPSAFTEAILVSLVDPPKILGIIPLSKRSAPNKNWQINRLSKNADPSDAHSDLFVRSNSSVELKGDSGNVVYKPVTNYVYPGVKHQHNHKPKATAQYSSKYGNDRHLNARKKHKSRKIRLKHKHSPRLMNKNKHRPREKRIKSDHKLVEKKHQEDAKKSKGDAAINERRLPLARILSKVLSILSTGTDATVTSEINKTEENVEYNDEEKEEERKKEVNEEDTMYRIIGGTPATGTGHPLNSRGRRSSNK